MLLLPAQHIVRKLPENYQAGELDFCKPEFAYDTNAVHQHLYTHVYINAKGHLYRSNYKIIEEALINPVDFKKPGFIKFLKKVVFKKKRALPANEQYLFCFDEWTNNHYHWICDFLPRLAVLKNEIRKYTLLLPDTIYLRTVGVTLLSTFNLLPKRIEWVLQNELVSIPSLQLITHPLLSGRVHDSLIQKVRSGLELDSTQAIVPGRRVYISRAKADHRKVINEDEVIAVLKGFNFEILNFEDLNIEQQMELSGQTTILVSIHGAGLTNAMFMQPNTAVLEFRRDGIYHNQCFWHLSSALGLKYYYLFGQPDEDKVIEGPHGCNLTISIGELRKVVERMIADNNG